MTWNALRDVFKPLGPFPEGIQMSPLGAPRRVGNYEFYSSINGGLGVYWKELDKIFGPDSHNIRKVSLGVLGKEA